MGPIHLMGKEGRRKGNMPMKQTSPIFLFFYSHFPSILAITLFFFSPTDGTDEGHSHRGCWPSVRRSVRDNFTPLGNSRRERC